MRKMTNKKLALLAIAGLGAFSGHALAGEMTVDSKGGLDVFSVERDDFWFQFSGRVFVDQAWFDVKDSRPGFPSGSHIRRARTTFKGGVGEHWIYRLDLDFPDQAGNPGNSQLGQALLGYVFCPNLWFAIGQVSVPMGLENWQSASDTPFMEYSLPSNAFAPANGIGVYGEWHSDIVTLAGAMYHPAAGHLEYGGVDATGPSYPGTGPNGSAPGSDPFGYGARITFSPIHDDFTVYHAGISARHEKLHKFSNGFNFSTGLEARSRQTPRLFTNIPPNTVEDLTVWGAELAGRWGPLVLQGEYMWADVNRLSNYPDNARNPGGALDYHGYYLAATYVLTGETKDYDFDTGTFGKVHPCSKRGAWEVGARYSFVNLLENKLASVPYKYTNDFVPSGVTPEGGNRISNSVNVYDMVGAVHSTTIGLTWWVNENVRFLANYVHSDVPQDIRLHIFALRGQVTW